MLEFPSREREEMSASAQTMLREYAGHRWPTMNHKGRIARLADVLGLRHRRVRSIYQNEGGVSLRADEMAAITALKKTAAADEENRDAFMALQVRVARLEAALAHVDEAFFDPQMAPYREALHGARRADEPGEARHDD
jgi:hypothetical protein